VTSVFTHLAAATAEEHATKINPWGLSRREIEVIHELRKTGNNTQVARNLRLDLSTVSVFVLRACRKMEVRNRTLMLLAYDRWATGVGL
jgi:DNA-binding NarL/FixJ family response regulator